MMMRKHYVPLLLSAISLSLTLAQPSGTIRSGPMVGYGEMTEVMLWIQLTAPADVQYHYWAEGNDAEGRTTPKQRANVEDSCVMLTLITGMEFGKRFDYEVTVNGKVVQRPYPLRFQTQALWQWRIDPPAFTVAFGSCVYVNDSTYDRPGKPYGSDYDIFSAVAAKKADLMLWLGDNCYYREADWTSEAHMRYRYAHTRSLPQLQPLLGATHNYAIWDDHDYGPNDSDRRFRLKKESLETFKLFWANHTYGVDDVPGVFQRFEWQDAEFFMLDDRYYRSPDLMPNDSAKTMFGREQLAWLKESLVESKAPFKIIVNGNEVLSPNRFESFGNFTAEYRELLHWIKAQNIAGVMFLSGDLHLSVLNCLRDTTFYPLYDFTCSSLTAGLSSSLREADNRYVVPGTFVNDAHTFGLLKFDGPRKDRSLTMECYDKDGKLRWSRIVMANELKAKGEK